MIPLLIILVKILIVIVLYHHFSERDVDIPIVTILIGCLVSTELLKFSAIMLSILIIIVGLLMLIFQIYSKFKMHADEEKGIETNEVEKDN